MATFIVTCPCCNGRLTIDPTLQAVIAHEAPPRPKSGADLGDAFSALKSGATRREERFKEQLRTEGMKRELLDRKFQEGMKRAKDLPDPPLRPIDID
jgi:hypothetical protein